MLEIFYAFTLLVLGWVFLVLLWSGFSILQMGPAGITKLRRMGFGWNAYVKGNLPETTDGANINIIEGLEILADNGRVSSVRRTRTLSDEIA